MSRRSLLEPGRDAGDNAATRVPFGQMESGPSRTFYRWSVVTLYTGGACRRTCIDHVPERLDYPRVADFTVWERQEG